MLKSQKTQWMIFIVVFLLVAAELYYIFFYHPPAPKNMSKLVKSGAVTTKVINVVGTSIDFDEKLASQSGNQIKKIILENQKKKRNFISYGYLLKALMIGNKVCPGENNCFFSSNPSEKEWKSDFDKDFPITISGPFIVRLNFYGNNGPSGVSLNGRVSKNNDLWWENIISIFFGIGDGGKRLYIDSKNNGPEPFLLFDKTFDKKISEIYILFNEKGTSFLVTDSEFNKIAFLDLNNIKNNKFAGGLFPFKQFYISYSIAPLSDLKVYDFSIL
jgi:hypothetical protein